MDEKNKYLRVILPNFSETSDFADFKSQPRRKTDALYWFVQEHGKVMGCVGEAIVSDMDKMVLGMNDWIITLAPSLVADQGAKVISENPKLKTGLYCHNGD